MKSNIKFTGLLWKFKSSGRRRLAKKDVLAKKQKWLPKICVETDKKARQGSWGPSDHLGPAEKQGSCDYQQHQ